MCHITALPPGVQPVREHLENAAEVNADGAGFAIVADGYLISQRDLDAKAITELFVMARAQFREHWAVIHYQTATSRKPAIEHVHPFAVGGDNRTLLFHNGTIQALEDDARENLDPRSDSRILAEDYLPHTDIDYLGKDLDFLELFIGPYSKVAVLSAVREEEIVLTRRDQWLVSPEGILYSNPDHLGQGAGWRECRDDDGKLYRWSALQPGQCPQCHLYGCKWLEWDAPTRRPCRPAATELPRFRCEDDRIGALR